MTSLISNITTGVNTFISQFISYILSNIFNTNTFRVLFVFFSLYIFYKVIRLFKSLLHTTL